MNDQEAEMARLIREGKVEYDDEGCLTWVSPDTEARFAGDIVAPTWESYDLSKLAVGAGLTPDEVYRHFGPQLFISDLHIGGVGYEEGRLCDVLGRISAERVWLLGDVFDTWAMDMAEILRRFPRTVEALGTLAKRTDLTWVLGNHDEEADLRAMEAGCDLVSLVGGPNYVLQDAQVCFPAPGTLYVSDKSQGLTAIIHGHEFDDVVRRTYPLAQPALHVAEWACRTFGLSKRRRNITPASAGNSVCDEIEREACVRYGMRGFAAVIMGHTHRPALEQRTCPDGTAILYANCGDCVTHFTGIMEERGELRLVNLEDM